MTTKQISKLIPSIQVAKKRMSQMSCTERTNLEKSWDVEHAYYSSSLEGSDIDRKEFEKIADKIK